MQSTETQNYDFLYEKLEEFYQLKINGNYPFNVKLNDKGQPLYKFETWIEPIDFDKECMKDISKGTGFYITKKQDIKKDVRSEDSVFRLMI